MGDIAGEGSKSLESLREMVGMEELRKAVNKYGGPQAWHDRQRAEREASPLSNQDKQITMEISRGLLVIVENMLESADMFKMVSTNYAGASNIDSATLKSDIDNLSRMMNALKAKAGRLAF